MTFVILREQSFSPKEELVQSFSGENQLYYLEWKWAFLLQMSVVLWSDLLEDLKAFPGEISSCNAASLLRAQLFSPARIKAGKK